MFNLESGKLFTTHGCLARKYNVVAKVVSFSSYLIHYLRSRQEWYFRHLTTGNYNFV
jgi:hypothetical protein